MSLFDDSISIINESLFKYILFWLFLKMADISFAVFNFFNSSYIGFCLICLPILTALVASAWASIINLSFSNLAFSTSYLNFSAFCWATCLLSIAFWYSCPKVRLVILVSSNSILYSLHLSDKLRCISVDIWSRWVNNWFALYWEIIDLLTSCTKLDNTTSS